MKASVASEKYQEELNLRFITCCVTCMTEKEVPVVKNVNQIWREFGFRTQVCLLRKILPWMKTKSQQRWEI